MLSRPATDASEPGLTVSGRASPGRLVLDRPLLTADEAGALLGGIPRYTVLQMARDGRLPCLRVGKHVRFSPSELEEWLARHRAV